MSDIHYSFSGWFINIGENLSYDFLGVFFLHVYLWVV